MTVKHQTSKDYMLGLDILRIVATFMVFLFHCYLNLGFRTPYEPINQVISVGATFMVCFFILSGFLLSCQNKKQMLLDDVTHLKRYYRKKLFRIIPSYFVFLIIVFLFHLSFPKEVNTFLCLIPLDLFALQAFFSKAFSFLGNGGTWFISVLLFLYLIFPFLQKILCYFENKQRHFLCIAYLFAMYVASARIFLGGDFAAYYANPLFRVSDFVTGMILGNIHIKRQSSIPRHKLLSSILLSGLLGLLYCIGVCYLYDKEILGVVFFKQNYLSYNILVFPIFAILTMLLANTDTQKIPSYMQRMIRWLSQLSFYFYLTQTFSNRITNSWITHSYFNLVIDRNIEILILSFATNMIFAMLMQFMVEKIINPILAPKILR